MKISKRELKRLIENYLFEQEDEVDPDEEAEAEAVESEEDAPDESEEDAPDSEEDSEEPADDDSSEPSIPEDEVIRSSLEGALKSIKDKQYVEAIKAIKYQTETTLKDMDGTDKLKVKHIPKEIANYFKLDKKDPEDIVNLKKTISNAGTIRKAIADQQK